MKPNLKNQQAAELIRRHFELLDRLEPGVADILVSAREAGRKMVEIYRLLTGEMPQSPGVEHEYQPEETPAVEWSAPTERDPNDINYVHPGDPDVVIKGDQHEDRERSEHQIEQGRSLVRTHR
jgi:hypothetical protein